MKGTHTAQAAADATGVCFTRNWSAWATDEKQQGTISLQQLQADGHWLMRAEPHLCLDWFVYSHTYLGHKKQSDRNRDRNSAQYGLCWWCPSVVLRRETENSILYIWLCVYLYMKSDLSIKVILFVIFCHTSEFLIPIKGLKEDN